MANFYFRAPRFAHLPHLSTMLDSIGNDAAVARLLGLSLATVKRYRKAGQAPRPVMLALFWETPWGRATADVGAINEARYAFMRSSELERENAKLKRQIETLERRLAFVPGHASNADFYQVGGSR